jgi:nucleotide-binding universal stress UspA family protein
LSCSFVRVIKFLNKTNMTMKNSQIKNILFPTDFSDVANNALNVAIAMAKRHDATLHLLHVIVPQYLSIVGDTAFVVNSQDWFDVEVKTKESLEKIALDITKKNGIKINPIATMGYVMESIDRYSENLNVDIIVMGTHGNSGVREFFIGSNAYSTIKNATCPVLTIPISCNKTAFENVLFPVRNVEGVEDKYDSVTQILKVNHSKVELLGVAHYNDFSAFDKIIDTVASLKHKMRNDNVEVIHNNEFCENIPDFILDYAATSNFDLLVINATIDNDWKRFFIGSFAQKIINHAKCPVLSIKPKVIKHEVENTLRMKMMEAKEQINNQLTFPQIAF